MEWEIMFLCNTIGVLLLVFIAFFHLIGVEKENNGEIIDTTVGAENKAGQATQSASAKAGK
jgi:uncharacterized protein (UPF0333 family)